MTSDAVPGLTAGSPLLDAHSRKSAGGRLLLAIVFLAGFWLLAVAVAGPARAAHGDPATGPGLPPGSLVTAGKEAVHAAPEDGVIASDPNDDPSDPITDSPEAVAPAEGTTEGTTDGTTDGVALDPPDLGTDVPDPLPDPDPLVDSDSLLPPDPVASPPAGDLPVLDPATPDESPADEPLPVAEPVVEKVLPPEAAVPDEVPPEPVAVPAEISAQVETAAAVEPDPNPAVAEDPGGLAVPGCSDTGGPVATPVAAAAETTPAQIHAAPVLASAAGTAASTPARSPQPLPAPDPPAPAGLPVPPTVPAPSGTTATACPSSSTCGSAHGDRHTLLTAVLAAGLPASLAQATLAYADGPDGSVVQGDDAPGDRPD